MIRRNTLVTVAQPAAGAGFTLVVPPGENWLIRAMRLSYTASATVASRYLYFGIDLEPGDAIVWQAALPSAIVASQTCIISAAINSPENTQNGAAPTVFQRLCLPEVWLPAGCKFVAAGLNGQAADQFSAAQFAIEKG